MIPKTKFRPYLKPYWDSKLKYLLLLTFLGFLFIYDQVLCFAHRCFVIQYLVSFLVLKSSLRGRKGWWFTLKVFLLSRVCLCSVSIPRSAMGWSVVYDCVFSWLYSLVSFYLFQAYDDMSGPSRSTVYSHSERPAILSNTNTLVIVFNTGKDPYGCCNHTGFKATFHFVKGTNY